MRLFVLSSLVFKGKTCWLLVACKKRKKEHKIKALVEYSNNVNAGNEEMLVKREDDSYITQDYVKKDVDLRKVPRD